MIPGDFFATLPVPRVVYPGRPSSRHIRSVPSSPSLSSRQFATVSLRPASRPIVSAASRFPPSAQPLESQSGTIGLLHCRYIRNGIGRSIPLPASLPALPASVPNRPIAPPPTASRLPTRPSCRGAERRPFPRVCVDSVNCPIYIYNLSSNCYSIGVEREQARKEIPK